jgi:predicted RNA binding protein YcfA (HicA-like mRNA interferase family)
LSKLITVSGREAVRRFEKKGWTLMRIHGSHAVLTKPGEIVNLTIPLHHELGTGIMRLIVRLSGLTVDEFNRLS